MVVKHLRRIDDRWHLTSDNPAYEPRPVVGDDRILGARWTGRGRGCGAMSDRAVTADELVQRTSGPAFAYAPRSLASPKHTQPTSGRGAT